MNKKKIKIDKWIDQILLNLDKLELDYKNQSIDNSELRKQLSEQYRLILLLKNMISGRTLLMGWTN